MITKPMYRNSYSGKNNRDYRMQKSKRNIRDDWATTT